MQSENIVQYKWSNGVYSLEDMMLLVKYKQITPEQFFEITRYDYEGVKKERGVE